MMYRNANDNDNTFFEKTILTNQKDFFNNILFF